MEPGQHAFDYDVMRKWIKYGKGLYRLGYSSLSLHWAFVESCCQTIFLMLSKKKLKKSHDTEEDSAAANKVQLQEEEEEDEG